MYAQDEFVITRETDIYTYKGGSGHDNTAHFCNECRVRVAIYNDATVGMVGLPLETLDNTNDLQPKLEIWIDKKLDMIKTLDSVVEHRSDSGVMGRLMALLEVHENR